MSDPIELPVPKVKGWRLLYEPDAEARCIKDNPPMYGFGQTIKKGDIVKIDGVCWRGKYEISVPAQCAFYELEGYFEPLL